MSELREAIKTLHARKDRAYGAAWKRRGERVSIIPNIARKVDRLTTFVESGIAMSDEDILDTAVDLYVYCLKYLLFLGDIDPLLARELALPKAVVPLSDNETNFDQLIDRRNYYSGPGELIDKTIVRISDAFERLWPAVEANVSANARFGFARELADSAEGLVMKIAKDRPIAANAFVARERINRGLSA